MINLCEMNYSETGYIVKAAFNLDQKRKISDFRKITGHHYRRKSFSVITPLCCTNQIKYNKDLTSTRGRCVPVARVLPAGHESADRSEAETEPPTYRLGVRLNFASHVIRSYQNLHVFKLFGWSG